MKTLFHFHYHFLSRVIIILLRENIFSRRWYLFLHFHLRREITPMCRHESWWNDDISFFHFSSWYFIFDIFISSIIISFLSMLLSFLFFVCVFSTLSFSMRGHHFLLLCDEKTFLLLLSLMRLLFDISFHHFDWRSMPWNFISSRHYVRGKHYHHSSP